MHRIALLSVLVALAPGSLTATGDAEEVVTGLPKGGHGAKTFTIARDGSLYVNVGSQTNSCQSSDRKLEVPGVDPCTELDTRAGIWRFDARKLHQTQAQGEHFARGIRNSVAITINPRDGDLYVMQHGRDQLGTGPANWPKLYNAEQGAELPAEEMFHVKQGDDFGWPYCYFDPDQKKKVLAPEYGGDGKEVGRCANKKGNVAYFPAHWAPNGLLFYTGSLFPARYREGAFIAFHGSWNRAPLPQAGFNVVFQPMKNGRADGAYEIFANGFAPNLTGQSGRGSGNRRPVGLAQGPDGALYITDDAGGRIWKVVATK
jgi:glucose/arabinose dehydrogenase